MIEHEYRDLYNQDSVEKQMIIAFDGGKITNTDLYSESFELTESLCSEPELRFGSCEASVIKFKIANTVDSIMNKWLTVSQVLNGLADTPFQFGKYKVASDVPSGDRNYRNVTAYDSMYDIINADVSAWYESLIFPITQKAFRDSFFAYFGITQEETVLIHDDMEIEKTIATTSISGKEIITAICELNGVFGHINRQGNFVYISLADKIGLYPSVELYPSNSLLPTNSSYDTATETLNKSRYISCEYEDFETSFISKLQIRQEQNDIGAIVGDGANTYIIEDNFLVYGKEPEELEEIANRTFDKIKTIQYRPMKVTLKGNPCLEAGDTVCIHTRNKEVASYILQRTIKGIQSLKDIFESDGVFEYAEKMNSTNKEVKQLRGKINILEKTVEQSVAKIEDVEKEMSTTITQTVKGLKVEIESAAENIGNLQENVAENTENINKTTYEFNTEDFTVSKEGEEIETHISHDGMTVKKDGQDVLVANNKGVDATNLHAKTYLIIGQNSRFEDYGTNRTGCFWIGS